MSDSRPQPALDRCGCCKGGPPDDPIRNAPGLPALRYRLATHSGFLRRMLHALPLYLRGSGDAGAEETRPLAGLTTRTSEDPTIALLDACAGVADVLTFYQERIANEGYLRTATERRSVLELARSIGYELSPGVAAGVHLSFTVEDAPGAPGLCLIRRGTQVQSVPPEGKLPQVFETSGEFTARAEWNALRPRLTRPARLAILSERVSPPGIRLCLLGPRGSFAADTIGLLTNVGGPGLFPLEPGAAPGSVDAVEVKRIYLAESAPVPSKGDRLLFAGKRDEQTKSAVLRVAEVLPEPTKKRVRVDLEPLPEPTDEAAPPPLLRPLRYIIRPFQALATVRLAPVSLNRTGVERTVLTKTWRERDLRAFIGIHRWAGTSLVRAVNTLPPAEPIALEAGAFSFREKAGFFGHNAPKWKSLPKADFTRDDPYPLGWDTDDPASSGKLLAPRTVWTDSQGISNTADQSHAFLERPVGGVVQKSWVLVESPHAPATAYPVYDARESSRADYGLSGKATALVLADDRGRRLRDTPTDAFSFRSSTAHVSSQRLGLAELPIETPIDETTTVVELDRMVLGLTAGQPVVFRGERSDLAGVEAAEVATLSDIIHSEGRTTLVLQAGLRYSYVRDKLTLCANVVHATHGETVKELLGSGDGSTPNQRLPLKKPPLTYVSAPTPRGSRSTLEVRVNGVRWEEVTSLYAIGPNREAYVVRIDDDARAQVIFGDGEQGTRLPSGSANVHGTYRSGIGPDGEVDAGTLTVLRMLPLGLRSVTNALDAGGAEAPERLNDARRNAPLTVLTFERVVSLTDYDDFARTFPGLGKSLGDQLWVEGREVVHLTVAGATGKEPDPEVLRNLVNSIHGASDGSQRFVASPFAQRYFTVEARVAVDPRYVAADVLAAVEERLRNAFSFEARQFGQSVTAAEVVALMHEVNGVVAVDLDSLAPYEENAAGSVTAPTPGADGVPARRARFVPQTHTIEPAELLLVNPVGIVLVEMKP